MQWTAISDLSYVSFEAGFQRQAKGAREVCKVHYSRVTYLLAAKFDLDKRSAT